LGRNKAINPFLSGLAWKLVPLFDRNPTFSLLSVYPEEFLLDPEKDQEKWVTVH
jgi:hypothetical protein